MVYRSPSKFINIYQVNICSITLITKEGQVTSSTDVQFLHYLEWSYSESSWCKVKNLYPSISSTISKLNLRVLSATWCDWLNSTCAIQPGKFFHPTMSRHIFKKAVIATSLQHISAKVNIMSKFFHLFWQVTSKWNTHIMTYFLCKDAVKSKQQFDSPNY